MTALISDEDKKVILESYWNKLSEPVKLIYFTTKNSSCQYCNTIEQLYKELTDMTDKLSLEVHIFEKEKGLAEKYNVSRNYKVLWNTKWDGISQFYRYYC